MEQTSLTKFVPRALLFLGKKVVNGTSSKAGSLLLPTVFSPLNKDALGLMCRQKEVSLLNLAIYAPQRRIKGVGSSMPDRGETLLTAHSLCQ